MAMTVVTAAAAAAREREWARGVLLQALERAASRAVTLDG
jgi:hypothetical protein